MRAGAIVANEGRLVIYFTKLWIWPLNDGPGPRSEEWRDSCTGLQEWLRDEEHTGVRLSICMSVLSKNAACVCVQNEHSVTWETRISKRALPQLHPKRTVTRDL